MNQTTTAPLDQTDRGILQRRLRGLVTPALVAEHRASPLGPTSPALTEVLHFLRRNPSPAVPRYVVFRRGEPPTWSAGLKPTRPGGPMVRVDDEENGDFATREEAEHAVFRLRLRFYGLLPR